MQPSLISVLRAAAAGAMACALAGCGTINSALTTGMADFTPQWAGGLPADAPPRPGTAKYDAYMQEQERLRKMPAAEREKLEAAKAAGQSSPASDPAR